jgi:acyl carrier protein
VNDTLHRLTVIFQEAFDDDTLIIKRETKAKDVEGWDSFMHVDLIVQIEQKLGFRFKSAEVTGFKNVGEMVDAIDRHLTAKG